jgi:hypothetical protein
LLIGSVVIDTEFGIEDHGLISTAVIERGLKLFDIRIDPNHIQPVVKENT